MSQYRDHHAFCGTHHSEGIRMNWKDVDTTHCGIAACADLFGDRWALLILRDVFAGVTRFGDLQRHTGASTAVLADRLRRLVGAGILRETAYREGRARSRSAYQPTEKGLGLVPVIVALAEYGYAFLMSPEQRIVSYLDARTGERVRTALVRGDGTEVAPGDLAFDVSPGALAPGYTAPTSRGAGRTRD